MSTTSRDEKGAEARSGRRDDPYAELLVAVLERDLVAVLERSELLRLDLPELEVFEDRRLRLFVHDPLAVALLRDANLAAIQGGDGLLDVHKTLRRIDAARSHSSTEGTSASRA